MQGIQIAGALEYLHDKGIVSCTLSHEARILLTARFAIKIHGDIKAVSDLYAQSLHIFEFIIYSGECSCV